MGYLGARDMASCMSVRKVITREDHSVSKFSSSERELKIASSKRDCCAIVNGQLRAHGIFPWLATI
jgi:hypothetical protein